MRYNLAKEAAKLAELGVTVEVKLRTTEKVSRPNSPEEAREAKLAILASESLVPEEGGTILQSPNDTPRAFSLVVNTPVRSDLAVVIVQGKMSQQVKALLPVKEDEGRRTFVRNFSTYPVYGGQTTKPEDNSLRIVSVRDGLLQIFSAAVITRLFRGQEKGAFDYEGLQEMYRAQLYRNETDEVIAQDFRLGIVTDEAEYGGFNRWPPMQALVGGMIPDKSLLSVLSPLLAIPEAPETFGPNQGRVIFFDVRRGFGFANTERGPRYFNWREGAVVGQLPYFEAGELIRFKDISAASYGEQLVGVEAA